MASTAKPKTPRRSSIASSSPSRRSSHGGRPDKPSQSFSRALRLRKRPRAQARAHEAVADGKLDQRGQSFAIPGLEFDEPEDEKVIIEVLDEGQFASSSRACKATKSSSITSVD